MLKSERLKIIRAWYPNAITTIDAVIQLVDFVEGTLALEPSQVMLANSICSDYVNSIQYPVRAQTYPCRYVMLIGTILINSDSDLGSFHSLKRATLITLSTGEQRDISRALQNRVSQ